MYNQVNRGPHSGQGSAPPSLLPPPPPLPPNYQQALPPPPLPPHFQHFVPPPAPHVYLHGASTSSTVPLNAMPNTRPSYGIPPRMHHGSGMGPQTFPNSGQNLQHPSNLGVQRHPIPVPPPIGHSHLETSWAPSRVLPPPPSSSQGQILYNHLPPPPPPLFRAPNPGGVYHHSTVGNYQVPSVAPSPPPLPTSPPPFLPSPPPPTPLLTSTSSQAACSDGPGSMKVSGFESKAVDSVDGVVASCPSGIVPVHNSVSDANQDGGSCGEVAIAPRDDELLATTSVTLDLPPPPPRPAEERTVQRIEALCQSIAENGADIEDKVRHEEYQNPEYAFLFDDDPGTEVAIAHAFFLWMKKKYNMEPGSRWHEKNTESQLRPLAVDTSGKQYHEDVATVSAESDMEMEG